MVIKMKRLFNIIFFAIIVSLIVLSSVPISANTTINGWQTKRYDITQNGETLSLKVNKRDTDIQVGVLGDLSDFSISYSFSNPIGSDSGKLMVRDGVVETYTVFGYDGFYEFVKGNLNVTYDVSLDSLIITIPTSLDKIYLYPYSSKIDLKGLETEVSTYIPFDKLEVDLSCSEE